MRLCKLAILNTVFAAVAFVLWREGLVADILANDIYYVMPGIGIVWTLGLITMTWNPTASDWCAEACVMLGFLGTVLGCWQAFTGIDADMVGDVNAIGSVIGVLLSGLGAAIMTTVLGALANLTLTANQLVVRT
jgi:hypothetical protein